MDKFIRLCVLQISASAAHIYRVLQVEIDASGLRSCIPVDGRNRLYVLTPMLPSSEKTYTTLRGLVPRKKLVAITEGFIQPRHDDKFPNYKFLVLSSKSLFIVTMNPVFVLTPAGERHYAMRLARGQSEYMAMQNAENWCGRFSRYEGDIGTVEKVPLCDIHVVYHGRWLATHGIWNSFRAEFAIDLASDSGYDFPVALGMEIDISGEQWSITSTLDSGLESFAEALISSTT